MSGSISIDTIIGSNKTVNVNTLQQASDVLAAVNGRSGSAGAFSFRNKIVDGRFDFWYEGTSQTSSGYGSDTMWGNINAGSTKVHSQQLLTAGVDLPAIEVPSAKYFSRTVVTSVAGSSNFVCKMQNIEGVGTLAGKTVTLSFYAKADSVKNIAIELQQSFGSGGSTDVYGIGGQLIQLSTTWARYSRTFTIPSIVGKTIAGSNDMLQVLFGFDIGSTYSAMYGGQIQQSGTFDLACVQLEEGSVATPFEELPIDVSLQRVGRYYETGVWGRGTFQTYTPNGDTRFTPFVYKYKKRTTPVVTFSQSTLNCIIIGNTSGTNSINIAITPTVWIINKDYCCPSGTTFSGYTYTTLQSAFGQVLVGSTSDTPTMYIDARL